MSQSASSPSVSGTFNFLTNLITLHAPPVSEYWRVQEELRDHSVFAKGGTSARAAREHRAVLVHEVTHFIDATTTIWGLEYNARKNRSARLQREGSEAEYEQGLQVFMLNSAEIRVHKDFTPMHQPNLSLAECTMHYSLSIHPEYGPLLTVSFRHEGKTVFTVPLSMLALLEANAYANEMLSRMLDGDLLADPHERQSVLADIEAAYNALMDRPGFVEYTLLLQLLNRSALGLGLPQRLRVMSAIARVALDADALQIAVFASRVAPVFVLTEAANSVVWDLRRGSSRAIIAFMSILALDGEIDAYDASGKDQLRSDLNSDPFGAVQRILKGTGLLTDGVHAIERKVYLEPIAQGYLHDKIIIPTSMQKNLPLVAGQACADVFSQLTLPDAIDAKGKSSFQFAKRISVAVTKSNLQEAMTFRRIEAHIHANPVSRFLRAIDSAD